MKYINMKGAFLKDNYQEVLKINAIDNDITNIHVEFELKDIVVLKGYYFKPTSKDEKEIEYGNKKIYKGKFTQAIVADTDSNALSNFMRRDMYENVDLTSMIRYSDIKPMLDLIKNKKIKDLRENKKSFISNIFNKSKKACILFINYETRERVFEYIEYDSEKNDDFFLEYSKKDFLPALTLSEKEVLDINEQIQDLKKKDFLSSGDNLFINPRSLYEKTITEKDIDDSCNILIRTVNALNETIEDVKNESKNKEEQEDIIKTLKQHTIKVLENDIKNIEFENTRVKDLYPKITFDYITLARHNKDKIEDLFDFIEEQNKKNNNLINYKNKLSELVI